MAKQNLRKFLAGAFFVSSGSLAYFYLAGVLVPLLGTGFVETPRISGGRSRHAEGYARDVEIPTGIGFQLRP
jgi:hypothetical protein